MVRGTSTSRDLLPIVWYATRWPGLAGGIEGVRRYAKVGGGDWSAVCWAHHGRDPNAGGDDWRASPIPQRNPDGSHYALRNDSCVRSLLNFGATTPKARGWVALRVTLWRW